MGEEEFGFGNNGSLQEGQVKPAGAIRQDNLLITNGKLIQKTHFLEPKVYNKANFLGLGITLRKKFLMVKLTALVQCAL
uniref:Uncharacterized protein n=1 Tax=Romanomermis culicivorax TaxID=13658 RepID=A0A915IPC6_ROMCU